MYNTENQENLEGHLGLIDNDPTWVGYDLVDYDNFPFEKYNNLASQLTVGAEKGSLTGVDIAQQSKAILELYRKYKELPYDRPVISNIVDNTHTQFNAKYPFKNGTGGPGYNFMRDHIETNFSILNRYFQTLAA